MDHDQATLFINELLRILITRKASDLFLTVGFPPAIKIDGRIERLINQPVGERHAEELVYSVMTERQRTEFEFSKECNFAIHREGIGRFRVNVFMQQGFIGMVMRSIQKKIPTLEELHLPQVLNEIALSRRGIVLVVGQTGSGKSTTLAALVDHRNRNSQDHIVTVEDPIEFVHEHINCMITQREIGSDTDNWAAALKSAMRQAPDVIMMGEIRDREALEHALVFAETGHLCLATMHASNAYQAIDRIINFFPEERKAQLLMNLSLNLRAMVSQRLISRVDGQGRVAAVEIMLNTPLIRDMIFRGDVQLMREHIGKSREAGMQTNDQHLFDLYEAEVISHEDALRNADSVNDVRLNIKLNSRHTIARDPLLATPQLVIQR